MSIAAKVRRAPIRMATGAYILNAGIGKLRGGDETAKGVHSMATDAYPGLERVDAKVLLRAVGAGELVLGAALLLPIVPAAIAGVGLAAFSGGLLGMYWRTPGMHGARSPLPTEAGTPFAKDVWLAGIATSLVVDSMLSPAHDMRLKVAHDLHEKRAVAGERMHSRRAIVGARARLAWHEARSAGRRASRRVREAVPTTH